MADRDGRLDRGEEPEFAADAHLALAAGVLHGAGPLVGRGLGFFLVGGVVEMLAFELDGPEAFMPHDAEDGPFRDNSHVEL